MLNKIKKYLEKLMGLLKNKNIIFASPFVLFTLGALILKSPYMILCMVFWTLVVIANTDEEI